MNLEKIETVAFHLGEKLEEEECDVRESLSSLFLTVIGISAIKGVPIDNFFPLCYAMEKCVKDNLSKMAYENISFVLDRRERESPFTE